MATSDELKASLDSITTAINSKNSSWVSIKNSLDVIQQRLTSIDSKLASQNDSENQTNNDSENQTNTEILLINLDSNLEKLVEMIPLTYDNVLRFLKMLVLARGQEFDFKPFSPVSGKWGIGPKAPSKSKGDS